MSPRAPSRTRPTARRWRPVFAVLLALAVGWGPAAMAQTPEPSVARQWNEALLQAIRDDLARPTVHARNLFHTAVAFYDTWVAYGDGPETTYLLGRTRNGVACDAPALTPPADAEAAREEAMSYAAYRLLVHRFRNSPGAIRTLPALDALLESLGYDPDRTATDDGSPAAVGNHLGECLVRYGLADGASEETFYRTEGYAPVNPPLDPELPGNPDIEDLNRWQPLTFDVFIDQSGNPSSGPVEFIGPEWGRVWPFALDPADRSVRSRDGAAFVLYGDPGGPPQWQADGGGGTDAYRWGFELVLRWAGHLDPADNVVWDISPRTLGNLGPLPTDEAGVRAFYAAAGAGQEGRGHDVNPATGEPYARALVRRADYTRVLAEFWADGPDSETPPGHWFVLLNGVSDDPRLEKRWRGEGPVLSDLEWDVKTYMALGGAMHDAAVTAWALKGWYDFVRPISAIRALAALGQSSQIDSDDYHPGGLPLVDGFIERIGPGDPLAGDAGEHVGQLKVWSWRGPAFIGDEATDVAGVGWIRAAEWWPYQRPTFVTPPFAGYVSGHSTFSRAAADVLTAATGDPYFPGGLGEFVAPAGEFLVFEDGPSEDVVLQWATYRDAADQCSLSRIWGGIHPPADDLPGRVLGEAVAAGAVELAEALFDGTATAPEPSPAAAAPLAVYPSPVRAGRTVTVEGAEAGAEVLDVRGRRVRTLAAGERAVSTAGLAPGVYVVRAVGGPSRTLVVLR